jgi:cell fate regulator YaaT (PSP1 superfamily)
MSNSQNPMEENRENDSRPAVEDISSEDYSEESELSSEQKENREDSRFKEGQILRFVRVRFPGNSRSFPFLVGKRRIEYGQKVVAMSDRGMAVGYVNSFPYDVAFNKSMLPIRSISKVADQEDIVKDKDAYRQQKEAENICNDMIEKHKLDMYLTHVEFTSFGKKAVFYFIAPARVDFRDLVRDLVGKLKTRIELRQISVRDRSAAVGGIGPCGLELCCSSFLTKYGNVGIKMAKNQDLTLNFSKLNGVCGQLKCCLQYEDDVYKDKRSRLPKEGDYISTHTGEFGRVDRLHLLNEQFVMMTNRGIRKRYVVDLYKDTVTKEEASFPNEFEFVTDETQKVIGLDESKARKEKAVKQEIKEMAAPAKDFAESIFENLFGEKSLNYSLPEIEEPNSVARKVIVAADDEEEIAYTPDEEDMLDDEDMEMADDAPIRTTSLREERFPRDGNRNEGNRQSGGGPRRDNRDNRDRNQGNRQHGGPRRDNNQNNNQQRRPQGGNQGQRGPGQRTDQRPQGGQTSSRNEQGRNRPPR